MGMDERESEAVRLLCRVLIGAGKYRRAREILEGLEQAAPGDAWVGRNLVLTLLRLGDFERALPLAAAQARTAQEWDRIPALFFQAHALWGCGRIEESRRVVEEYARELEKRNNSIT